MKRGIHTASIERVEKYILKQKKNFTINYISKCSKIHPQIVKIAFKYLERMNVIIKVPSSTQGQLYRGIEK